MWGWGGGKQKEGPSQSLLATMNKIRNCSGTGERQAVRGDFPLEACTQVEESAWLSVKGRSRNAPATKTDLRAVSRQEPFLLYTMRPISIYVWVAHLLNGKARLRETL